MDGFVGGGWGAHEAAGSRLVDERFRRVVAEVLDSRFVATEASFSGACGGALRQAAGRLLRNEKSDPDGLLAGHVQSTVERCMGENVIVVSQDSSTYNFSGLSSATGLGPVNDRSWAKGIHQHSALAMTEDRLPLGVVHVEFWVRSEEKKPANERKKLPIEQKESFKWLKASRAIEAAFEPYFAAGGHVVVVQDREADIFELVAEPRHAQMDIVIRVAHPRKVEPDGADTACSVFEAVSEAPVLGEYEVEVLAREGKPARIAVMQLRSAHATIRASRSSVSSKGQSASAWIVQASELTGEGFEGEPLQWTLITSLDASDKESAHRVIRLYTCRWEIERLHYTLKSGCAAERLQMDDAHTLMNALALYIIVAWRLLYVTHLARADPGAPASQVIDETEQAVLEHAAGRSVATVAEVVVAVARLAGYEPYKNGPPPGVKSLWLGLRKLESMAQGWRLAMQAMRTRKM